MFTQRALLLGFVAFCFYLIAVVNSLPAYYYVLMWLALGLLAASLGIAFLALNGLDVSWEVTRSRGHASAPVAAEAGRDLEMPVVEATLKNVGSLNKTGVVVELHLRDEDRQSPVVLGYLLEAVPAGQTLDVALPLRDLARGRYTLGQGQLVGSDVLGLFRARRRLELDAPASITIGPALLPLAATASFGRGGRARHGASRRARPGGGDELRGTRPYVAGDDMRHIHWKSTARTGELVMREWEQIGHSSTIVVWDGAQGSEWGGTRWNSTECGLILVASLLATFSEKSLPCGLAVLGEAARFCKDERGVGNGLAVEQLEALAQARAARQNSLTEALNGVWHSAREVESLTLITASLAPDVPELVRSLGAQNIGVRVALVDGAALGALSQDRRFRGRGASAPLQQDGPTPVPIAVTSAAYRDQAQQLERAGAQVTPFAPRAPDEIWPALEATLARLVNPHGLKTPVEAVPRQVAARR